MRTLNFTEFRRQASTILNEVENGESFVITRHGKPIAEILPYLETDRLPAWKQPVPRLQMAGASLSAAILAERETGS